MTHLEGLLVPPPRHGLGVGTHSEYVSTQNNQLGYSEYLCTRGKVHSRGGDYEGDHREIRPKNALGTSAF